MLKEASRFGEERLCGKQARPGQAYPVADLGALDDFLSGWWRIATRAAADPAGWQRMYQEADQLQSGAPGRPDPGRGAGPARDPLVGNGRILRQAGNMYVWDYKGISVTYVLLDPQREVAVLRADRFPA
jgi:hypothetical protein